MSTKDLFAQKKQAIERRKQELKERLAKAPAKVQAEFRRCSDEIGWAFRVRTHAERLQPFEFDLCKPGSLEDGEMVLLQDLLKLEGWNVVLSAPLEWNGPGPRPLGLQFRHNPDD